MNETSYSSLQKSKPSLQTFGRHPKKFLFLFEFFFEEKVDFLKFVKIGNQQF